MNAQNRQAGVKAFKHEEFLRTPHVSVPCEEEECTWQC
jgi:hypothetical protein